MRVHTDLGNGQILSYKGRGRRVFIVDIGLKCVSNGGDSVMCCATYVSFGATSELGEIKMKATLLLLEKNNEGREKKLYRKVYAMCHCKRNKDYELFLIRTLTVHVLFHFLFFPA